MYHKKTQFVCDKKLKQISGTNISYAIKAEQNCSRGLNTHIVLPLYSLYTYRHVIYHVMLSCSKF